jgi:hypothetical protein
MKLIPSTLRRAYLKRVPTYRRLEMSPHGLWDSEDKLRRCALQPGGEIGWRIAKEEDTNKDINVVYLEKVQRVWE